MTLQIETIVGGPFETNAYLVADDATGDAVIIDAPMDTTEKLVAAVLKRGWTARAIVITHTHWDHVVDAAALKSALGVPLLAHIGAVPALANPQPVFAPPPVEIQPVTPDRTLQDGDEVMVGGHAFTALHLPGHEPFHIGLWSVQDGVLFGGDVLFPKGHGRTDIPGSDQAEMNATLKRLVAELPEATTVYTGHGLPTSVGAEAGWIREIA
jgi:glyoxylase-like metal-dependent hydrolase (beta-lactamase superfamily II)